MNREKAKLQIALKFLAFPHQIECSGESIPLTPLSPHQRMHIIEISDIRTQILK